MMKLKKKLLKNDKVDKLTIFSYFSHAEHIARHKTGKQNINNSHQAIANFKINCLQRGEGRRSRKSA